MRNRHFITLFTVLFSIIVYSQNTDLDVKVGDVFVIGDMNNDNYEHIYFPKSNFIIKRGGIVNYKNIKGKKIEVTSIKEEKDGTVIATIKLTSKKSFFGSHKYVKADIIKAIRQKELLRI